MSLHTLEMVVVACKKRDALVLPYLEAVPHQVLWTTDYDLPEGFKPKPEYGSLLHNQTGHYRCFRGHQDALKDTISDAVLVVEDDALPNREDWSSVVASAFKEMPQFEVISLHGRAFHREAFEEWPMGEDTRLLTPKVQKSGQVWVQGSLAYIIRRDAIPRFLERVYDGFPIDIYLCNEFTFGLVDPSPFNHGSQLIVRSLID